MGDRHLSKSNEVAGADLTEFLSLAAHRTWPLADDPARPPEPYRVALGREPIDLGIVEFRIMLFLAGRPYHAFTRREIAEAVHTDEHPVTEDSVDQHIDSLLAQLGVFHDYVQAVPYIGYRFKA
jgi:DNA-binding response OmpR family regulator